MKKIFFALLMVMMGSTFGQVPPDGLNCDQFRLWVKQNFYDGKHDSLLTYDKARQKMFGWIDSDLAVRDSVECVYSGYKVKNERGTEVTSITTFNTEHVVPQSFFNNSLPMLADIHHLFPVYDDWNSTRSNHPFREIPDNQTTKWMYLNQSQSNIPSSNINAYSEFKSGQFEPRESVKGNIARAVFYFFTMYEKNPEILALNKKIEDLGDVAMLIQWHQNDPVDALELKRDSLANKWQKNHNPYILHPDWVVKAFGGGCAVGVVNHLTGLSDVQLFPNPAHNQLILSGSLNKEKSVQVTVLNAMGQIILTQQRTLHYGAIRESFDVTTLAKGMYILHLESEEGQLNISFVKN
ncbi:MAG: endonuclease [Chitinophagales bacterium]|nr:endonuclease [Chitinophagales bacterium]